MLKINDLTIPDLAPVSLTINKGECVGITGVSGSGKTRLLRAIADLDEHSGNIRLDDVDWREVVASEWRKRVAYLPAESQWWCDTLAPHYADTDLPFAELGLPSDVLQWQVSRCSSGEKQRLAILRLLVNRPPVLLLDEPTSNLDADNSLAVEKLIADYVLHKNACVIWVSHNREQLQRVAKKCFSLSDGKLMLLGN